jgi:hypothetical protein
MSGKSLIPETIHAAKYKRNAREELFAQGEHEVERRIIRDKNDRRGDVVEFESQGIFKERADGLRGKAFRIQVLDMDIRLRDFSFKHVEHSLHDAVSP